jgi:hypothetical protein
MLKKYLHKLLCLSAVATALLATSTGYSASSSSSSSSSSTCSTQKPLEEASEIQAPPYITSEGGMPVMHIGVLNRSDRISKRLLIKVLETVKQQVEEDFAPFYGIHVKFHIFKHQSEVDWSQHVPLIIDDFLPDSAGCGFISFHSIQNTNGFPIELAVFDPPSLPAGTPYIVVPIGSDDTCYGIKPAFDLDLPFLPQTFQGFFCQTISHEVLETLHNYTGTLATLDFSGEFFGPGVILSFFQEVCDPVSFSRGYRRNGLNVANFVLPSYWVNDLPEGPFDFLNTVEEPLIPFSGEQDLILSFACGSLGVTITSPPACIADPHDFIINAFLISFCGCCGGVGTVKDSPSIPNFLKGTNAPYLVNLQGSGGSAPSGQHFYKPYTGSLQKAMKQAA